jgi:hypothetical protein
MTLYVAVLDPVEFAPSVEVFHTREQAEAWVEKEIKHLLGPLETSGYEATRSALWIYYNGHATIYERNLNE